MTEVNSKGYLMLNEPIREHAKCFFSARLTLNLDNKTASYDAVPSTAVPLFKFTWPLGYTKFLVLCILIQEIFSIPEEKFIISGWSGNVLH